MGTGTAVVTYDEITAAKMNLKLENYLSTTQKAYFGSAQGSSAIALDGTDPDQVVQAHGKITSAIASGAYAASYHTLTYTAVQTNDVSGFAVWGELYWGGADLDFSHGSNYAAVWGNFEVDTTGVVTSVNSSCYMAGVVGTVIVPSGFVNNSYLCGVIADGNITSGATNNLVMAGLWVKIGAGTTAWSHGVYISDDATAIGIYIGDCTTGIDLGTCTTSIDIGSAVTGIDFTGTYTGNAIDFSDVTINHTGSNGPCFIRAGTYASPVLNADEDQSGFVRLYGETSADGASYDRGIFVCLKTSGIKGIFPIAGLAEVLAQGGNGPTKVQAAQFICDLHTVDAKLAGLGGDSTAGMYGAWLKITAIDGATISATARAAPLWLDNQLYGAHAATIGEEYAIFSTAGGTIPKAWAGFETTSAGWTNFLYFDETSYDQAPVVSSGCDVAGAGASEPYLRVSLNGSEYGIPLIAI